MTPHSHRRQVLLFFAAVLLPCMALVALGLRLVVQERELARARLEDEQRRVVLQLQQDLTARLERTALRQVTARSTDPEFLGLRAYDDSIVALVARVSGGQLILPWEEDERPRQSRFLLGQGVFGERIRQGEQAEFASGNPAGAATFYRRALDVAEYPVQEAHARLYLARALGKAGHLEDAGAEYLRLVVESSGIVDESGVPLALYAARQLLKRDSIPPEVLEAIRGALATDRWLPPGAVYLIRDLTDTLSATTSNPEAGEEAGRLAADVAHELAQTEQALALKREFPSLGIRIPNDVSNDLETRWIRHGEPAWFVGAGPVGERNDGLVLGIRTAPLLASLESDTNLGGSELGKVSILTENGEGLIPLGSAFPGLFVQFDPPEGGLDAQVGSVRWWFYAAGLLLVFGVTFFGAYLLWRDVRREVQLAETRSRFVAAVSHELKTPLTAIRMFAETLRDSDSPPPETQSEYLDTIVNESERLTRLINNVLDFSKIEGGRKTYRLEYQPLQELVRFTARAMRYPLEQKRFVLHLDIEASMPPVQVDRDAIEQALLNLLANAMKYSGDSRNIDLRLRSENGEAVIEVADQGVGIDLEDVPRIFDRFFRVERPENDRVPGAGLGLTLVQHIAEAHGGRVAVKSEPGSGSTFSLFLPMDGARA